MSSEEPKGTDNRTHWESVAGTRWGRHISEVQRSCLAFAMSSLANGKAVESGYDGGRWSRLLADAGWVMTCLDIDARTLQLCQANIPDAKCVLTSPEARTLPCDDGSAQLLLCSEALPVIQSDWFAGEAHRILTAGGLVVGVFWNRRSLRGGYSDAVSHRRGAASFYSRNYREQVSHIRQPGFEFIKKEGCCWVPFSRESNSGLVHVFTTLEKCLGLRKIPDLSPWIVCVSRKVN